VLTFFFLGRSSESGWAGVFAERVIGFPLVIGGDLPLVRRVRKGVVQGINGGAGGMGNLD
jgi:hypothetical protein